MVAVFYPPRPLANPTASVGLTAVNGTAQTAMRSDGAPPLDVTAAFAFSNLSNTIITANGALSSGAGPGLKANGTWITGGTGTTNKPYVLIEPNGTTSTAWNTSGTGIGINADAAFNGNLIDAQAGGTSLFRVNAGGGVTAIGAITAGQSTFFTLNGRSKIGSPADGSISFNSNNAGAVDILTIPVSATWQLGAAAADTTGVSQTLQAQGVTTGGTNNQAGGSLTVQPGQGKGTAISSLIFKSPVALASGNTLQTQTQSFAGINGSLVVGPGSALGTTATDGFIYIPTCAGPPTGTPTANTGAAALVYDTTNDQLYIYRGGWKQPKTPAGAAIVTWQ